MAGEVREVRLRHAPHAATPPETEPWGERYCQFADDNGIVWQLVEWAGEPA